MDAQSFLRYLAENPEELAFHLRIHNQRHSGPRAPTNEKMHTFTVTRCTHDSEDHLLSLQLAEIQPPEFEGLSTREAELLAYLQKVRVTTVDRIEAALSWRTKDGDDPGAETIHKAIYRLSQKVNKSMGAALWIKRSGDKVTLETSDKS